MLSLSWLNLSSDNVMNILSFFLEDGMRLLIALCFIMAAAGVLEAKQEKIVRNYDAPLTKQEKEDISYIITYLSEKSYPTLLWHKFSLEAAGERIDHVHPLRFFICVLTDEELVKGVKKIYWNGGKVWSDFVGGIKESLKDEFHRNNLRDDQLIDFAKIVGIESHDLFMDVHERKWTEFVVHLIKNG